MKIETKFNLDQEVWVVTSHRARKIVKCDVCTAGKIMIGNEEFVCPKCSGRSALPQYGGDKWLIYHHGIIGKIQTEHYGACAPSYDNSTKHTYMIDSTGIGSGTCWEEKDLFASKDEAQADCDKKNGLLNLEDEVEELPALI